MQHGRLARVEVQHAPGNAANHGHQLGGVPSGRRAVMQHDVQSPPGAVLHDQVQIISVLTQTPQAHYVVMGPCRMRAPHLGLFVRMENELWFPYVDTTSTQWISDSSLLFCTAVACMIGSVCMRYALQCLDVLLHEAAEAAC